MSRNEALKVSKSQIVKYFVFNVNNSAFSEAKGGLSRKVSRANLPFRRITFLLITL